MKVFQWACLLSSIVLTVLIGCSPSKPVILEVGSTKVTLEEYERFFSRNSNGNDAGKNSTLEDRERFLDLLTNYHLKLQDAYSRNLQNDSEIVQELRDYRSSLASTFIIDKEVTGPGINKMYEHRKEEIRAQHILISMKYGASPPETLVAWKKAIEVFQHAVLRENFDSLAAKYSDDPATKFSGGDIYYFTSGQMMEAFENAAYSLQTGEITPMPVRTPLGYHIIKIVDRVPARGSMKVRHMMARFKVSETDSTDTTLALQRIRALQDSLKKGMSFSTVALKFSEDVGSAQQGGDLGWFERRRWVQPFDEACFKLSPGQTSDIVKTPFGYHLIHCDSVKQLAPFSEMRDELRQLYQRNRYNDDYAAYMSQLKRQYHYALIDTTLRNFLSHVDSIKSVGDSAWDARMTKEIRKQPIIMLGNKPVALDVVIINFNKKPDYHGTSLRLEEMRLRIDRIAESLMLEDKSSNMESMSPDFAALMKEYEQGVVLFKAEQTEVWNNITVTDSALKNYYQMNRGKFMHPVRVAYSEIRVSSDTLAYLIYDLLAQGGDFGKLAAKYNEDPELKAKQGVHKLKPITSDELTTFVSKMNVGETSEPQEVESGVFSIIKLTQRDQPREKSYEEAGAEVSNAYQEFLSKQVEQQWVERVKQKYPVKQYKERLKEVFASPQTPH